MYPFKTFTASLNERPSLIQQLSGNQTLVTACNQMIQSFPARALRVAAKLRVVEVMKSSISFRDICCRRVRCSQQLIAWSIALLPGQNRNDLLGRK
jgi:hypothetical protein